MSKRRPRRPITKSFIGEPTYVCYFDGAVEPRNPGGTGGVGAVIFKGNRKIWEHSSLIPAAPNVSNNVAEYKGFIAILDRLLFIGAQNEKIQVYGDSNLVIQQCFGSWRVKKGFYTPYAAEARTKLLKFTAIKGNWIPREKNFFADDLSKAQLIKANVHFRIQPLGV